MAKKVLVIDDELEMLNLIKYTLEKAGYQVEVCDNGRQAWDVIQQVKPDLMILDVMLPDLSGLEVLRRLSAEGRKVPVIFLTARDATEDKVHGLTIGGDDYVTKPFSIEELVARVRVVLRRHGDPASSSRLTFADLELDDDAHEVRRAGQAIDLTPTEYRLLRYLLANAGRVLTRTQILDHVWDYDFGGDASVLETYISYLRRKVDRVDPPLIQTVRGVGYVMRSPNR